MTKEKLQESVTDNATTPSMEDILSSIRGIINDDISMAEETKQDTSKEEDILELTEVVEEKKQDASPNVKVDKKEEEKKVEASDDKPAKEDDKSFKEQVEAKSDDKVDGEVKDSEEVKHELPKDVSSKEDKDTAAKKASLISGDTASEAQDAMRDLVKKSLKPTSDGLSFRSGTSLEDVVVEAMTPYLTRWLDDNLPTIVKNLVSKEIQKLVPKEED